MDNIRKVVFLINRISASGGAERVITVLANQFAKRGIESTIITRQETKSVYYLDERVKVVSTNVSCSNKLIRNTKRNIMLRKLIKECDPDVIISFMTPMNIQASLYTIGLKYPLIISERNNPETDISKRDKLFAKFLYPRCNGFVFQTEDAQKWFSKNIQSRSTIICNPISENLPERKPAIKGKIVNVARLNKQKNQKMLIDAIKMHRDNGGEGRLTIFGVGPEEASLRKYIEDCGLNDVVELAGYRKDVLEQISDAELFILSSDYEGMPNALIEAMGIGIACISTDCPCGGPRYLIENGRNGILVDVGNTKQMAEAISKVLSDEKLRCTIEEEACKICELLNPSSIAQEWLTYCSKVLREGK